MGSKRTNAKGFTLIEILVVIGIIAILAAIVIIAINPARQFAQARNSQRTANVNAFLNGFGQRIADHKGLFRDATETTCTAAMDIPGTAISRATAVTIGETGLNVRPCLVPTYMPELPFDPKDGVNTCDDTCSGATTYDTKYVIYREANGRITVCAPNSTETGILDAAEICVTR